MKLQRKILSVILVVAFVFACVPAVFAEEYIIPSCIYESEESLRDFNMYYRPYSVTGYANLWYKYEGTVGGTSWPAEYLDIFEGNFTDAVLGNERVNLYDYYWRDGNLVVDYGVTFNVKYSWHVGNSITELYGPTADEYMDTTGFTVAIRKSEDHSLAEVIKVDGTVFIPELRYDTEDYIFTSSEKAKEYEKSSGMELEYISECRQMFEITIPDYFDPDVYEISVYYEEHEFILALLDTPMRFSTPFEISTSEYKSVPEPECVFTYNEIGGSIRLPYTLEDDIPEEYGNYFEELLNNPVDSEYMGVHVNEFFLIGDNFGTTVSAIGSIFEKYLSPNVSHTELIYARDMYLIAAVAKKDSGDILGLELIARPGGNIKKYREKLFNLPDYFDIEKHQIVFLNYIIDFYPMESKDGVLSNEPTVYVCNPVYVDVSNYIFGDANKDGKVNLTDVSLMLKYLAKWDNVKLDNSILNLTYGNNPYIDARLYYYNMTSISFVLKIICGWDIDKLTEDILDYHTYQYYICAIQYIVT